MTGIRCLYTEWNLILFFDAVAVTLVCTTIGTEKRRKTARPFFLLFKKRSHNCAML